MDNTLVGKCKANQFFKEQNFGDFQFQNQFQLFILIYLIRSISLRIQFTSNHIQTAQHHDSIRHTDPTISG